MAYTTIDDPSAYFHVNLHSGNGTDNTDITFDANAGDFQPDFIWFKGRTSSAIDHALFDSSRGTTKILNSNQTNAEDTQGATLKVFNSNGFRVGDDAGDYGVNASGRTYVTWNWKANGGTTTSGGGDDSIGTSAYQANDTAGFSIITYTGNNTDDATVKHGLSAEPDIIISKSRTSAHHWFVHGNAIPTGDTNYMLLQVTGAVDSAGDVIKSIGSSTVTIGTNTNINTDASLYVQYAFRSIQGYSKFGTYEGNGNADGTFVYTGFKPAWVMTKSVDSTSDWEIFDNKREGYNVDNDALVANQNIVEATADQIDLLSNGFKLRIATDPNVAETYIYMAFAEHPFVTSGGVPATAR